MDSARDASIDGGVGGLTIRSLLIDASTSPLGLAAMQSMLPLLCELYDGLLFIEAQANPHFDLDRVGSWSDDRVDDAAMFDAQAASEHPFNDENPMYGGAPSAMKGGTAATPAAAFVRSRSRSRTTSIDDEDDDDFDDEDELRGSGLLLGFLPLVRGLVQSVATAVVRGTFTAAAAELRGLRKECDESITLSSSSSPQTTSNSEGEAAATLLWLRRNARQNYRRLWLATVGHAQATRRASAKMLGAASSSVQHSSTRPPPPPFPPALSVDLAAVRESAVVVPAASVLLMATTTTTVVRQHRGVATIGEQLQPLPGSRPSGGVSLRDLAALAACQRRGASGTDGVVPSSGYGKSSGEQHHLQHRRRRRRRLHPVWTDQPAARCCLGGAAVGAARSCSKASRH